MDILNFITEYWSVLAFIGVVIASWIRYESKNNSQDDKIKQIETRTTKLEAKVDSNETVVSEIKITLAEIKTTLKFIREKLDK